MRKNYFKILIILSAFMMGLVGYSQNIQVSIINAQNTNDGSNDYYEADVVIQTIDGQADFKLGSGQVYFNYNKAAFGESVDLNNRFEVTAVYSNGYSLGEKNGPFNIYDINNINDNNTSRVSWGFSQLLSSGAMTEIVGSIPKLMVHVKFTYVDVNKLPMVAIETNENAVSSSRDQFYTACGPYDEVSNTLDCTADNDPQNVNVQFFDATFTPTTTNWTGNSNTDWDTAANWNNGVPTTDSSVNITNVTNDPVASGAINVYSMLLHPDAALTVNSAVSNTEAIGIESGASLIAKTSVSGSIRYHRGLETNNWYLVSSPVSGETVEDIIANHTLATGTDSNIGLAPYVNDGTAWNYQTSGSTGPLSSGLGYSVKLASAGDISLIGSMPVTDVGIPITSNTNAYNLIGNPYPSYIPANTNADLTNNILTTNFSSLTEATLWFWNQATSSYDPVNQTTAGTFIAPAQGFFVSSIPGGATFNFTEAMQSHQSSDNFQRDTATRPEIQLLMTDGATTKDADIFYIEGTTTGFDNGYDSSIFGGVANSFAVYTHAVANGQGRDLGIQSLPVSDYENMIIPIGINAIAGETITFTANVQNLPEGLKVFLEDTQTGTFTQLNVANGEYTVTLDNDMSGIGRFYLRTTSQTLGIDAVNLDNISIYTTADNSILNIEGLNDGKASLQLFDLTGKRILDASFLSNRVNTVNLPHLESAVYIVQLQSETASLYKKIVID